MAPRTTVDVDKHGKVTDIYFGNEHYVVEGDCNRCGECCRQVVPPILRKPDGTCMHLTEKGLCDIDNFYDKTAHGDTCKPWFCKQFPYDLECFEMLPECCPIKLRRVE